MPENSERITQQFEQVGKAILQGSRNELYLSMRYLDLALSSLQITITTEFAGIGTDGLGLYAHPKILSDLFESNRLLVNRVYLHNVMHCLLRHIVKSPREDALLWRVSCDIAVESVIDTLRARAVRMGVSRLRRNWYELLGKEMKAFTAERIYHVLRERGLTPFEQQSLLEAFCIDDHRLWPAQDPDRDRPGSQPPPMGQEAITRRWQDISEKTRTRMDTLGNEEGEGEGGLQTAMEIEDRERYDYKTFLRKFSALHEEIQADPDTFDYVFYTYGLSLYGNLPLIEPQEMREVHRIAEFVIVIDVSMSTQGDLVKTFLEQTYQVLTERDSYTRQTHIRILQCDDRVQSDVEITSPEELEEYRAHLLLTGGGGTDFRPAFWYIQQLREEGELSGLKGMLYFTDGKGTYPARPPAWDTAFVFMEEDYTDVQVPPWAMKLIVEKEDLEEARETLRTDYQFLEE